jgi:hypothetical protein
LIPISRSGLGDQGQGPLTACNREVTALRALVDPARTRNGDLKRS